MRSVGVSVGSPPTLAASIPKETLIDDAALRGMRATDVRGDGKIKKVAFMPRSNGKDRDGLSVSIADRDYPELHRAKYEQPGKAIANVLVRDVRSIGLTVLAAPDQG